MEKFGTSEHAAVVTEGRDPDIHDALQWLTFAHLPESLRRFSYPFYAAAATLIDTITTDSPELKASINGLIAAKDSAVRAGIRHDTGRAGSVPRPQAIVDRPQLFQGTNHDHAPQFDGRCPYCRDEAETLLKVKQMLRGVPGDPAFDASRSATPADLPTFGPDDATAGL